MAQYTSFDPETYYALQKALRSRDSNAVRLFWEANRVDLNMMNQGYPPLLSRCLCHSPVKLLVENGAALETKDASGNTSLVKNHYTEAVEMMIKLGADVNAVCSKGYTVLNQAASKSQCSELLLLIENVVTNWKDHIAGNKFWSYVKAF
jgi:ankyrin repeat protein